MQNNQPIGGPGPPRSDHRPDDREEHLAKDPDSVVGREVGEPVHRGTRQPECQVQAITQEDQRHDRPRQSPNGPSRQLMYPLF